MLRLRLIAAIIFAIGLIALVLGMLKVLPTGATNLGTTLMFGAAILGGISLIKPPTVESLDLKEPIPPPLSNAQLLTGIFYEPTRVFQDLRVHPRWLAAVLVMGLISGIYQVAAIQRLTPERISNFLSDKIMESGFAPPPERAAQMRAAQLEGLQAPLAQVASFLSQFVTTLVFLLILSGIFLLVVTMFGGRLNFWQALSIAAFSGLPFTVIQKLLSLVLLYIKDPDDIHPLRAQQTLVQDNLSLLFSPAQNPVLFSAASMIGVLTFYWVWLMATGLRNGGTRVSNGAAWSTAIAVWALLFLVVVVSAALFPGFIA